ncbi:hypothetical protein RN001_000792 [Aquatica leii]|uniref:Uncharacterized protein n=1 Tax=Aquatica leii TaxID=1421715 RepID=A0AAN7SCF0_9COLE|nr:hypothetical protein RN001_000792 [Aquatica leii]
MHATHSQAEAPPYQAENAISTCSYNNLDPPPSYNEVHPPSYGFSQQTHFQNTSNYGACPAAPPPPYTPSPSRMTTASSHRTHKGEYIPQSGIMMPLNASSSSFQTEESAGQKKYAAYICCAVFIIIVMFAAYLGRNSKKYHTHYRYNYDWG